MEIHPSGREVTAGGIGGKQRARDYALRVVFTLALAWALLSLGMMLFGERAGILNPVQEGSRLHTVVEDWAPGLVAVVAATILAAFLVRFEPRFLSVPAQVTSLRLCVSLLVTTAIVGVALLLVLIAVAVILDPLRPHPENVQYIPIVFWLPPLATAALTPAASVVIAWGWTVRKLRS